MNETTKSPMQASKWLQMQALLDADEMEMLLTSLGEIQIFIPGRVIKKGEERISPTKFLQTYSEYVKTLQQGKVPEDALFRSYFSSIWTLSSEVVFSVNVDDERHLLRVAAPAVQLQLHRLGYSELEGKFRPMIFGKDSIDWGIQFSYPQLFQNPQTHQTEKVDISPAFPNTLLFQQLQRWFRSNSQPTPFVVQGKKVNVPIRLGKNCFSWINRHPQLVEKNMKVEGSHGGN
jgi:hypothetical protein